eukprot:TRINITY_DN10383_c0_g1_i1.p1 TRINITY_DN10383_c0_g1~~TRINITY_DN10383_c0_g1_i1.p1  ORF type:complete len:329 (-),score=97.59 TRINITY_DN10383_c0_g1_i1:387-1373(-)
MLLFRRVANGGSRSRRLLASGMNGPSMDMILSLSMGYKKNALKIASQSQLVDSLKANGVLQDGAVSAAMRDVDRAAFAAGAVNGGGDVYEDKPCKMEGTVMTAPHMHALALQALAERLSSPTVEEVKSAADIGCGSGYVAAVMEKLFPNAEVVYAVDFEGVLKRYARLALSQFSRVKLVSASEFKNGKVDAVHVGFAMRKDAADEFAKERLNEGGVMIVPIGEPGTEQELFAITKRNEDLTFEKVMQCLFSDGRITDSVQDLAQRLQELQEEMIAVAEELKSWRENFQRNNGGLKPNVAEMPQELLGQYASLKRQVQRLQHITGKRDG